MGLPESRGLQSPSPLARTPIVTRHCWHLQMYHWACVLCSVWCELHVRLFVGWRWKMWHFLCYWILFGQWQILRPWVTKCYTYTYLHLVPAVPTGITVQRVTRFRCWFLGNYSYFFRVHLHCRWVFSIGVWQTKYYTVGHKKRATFIFPITLAIVDQFQ